MISRRLPALCVVAAAAFLGSRVRASAAPAEEGNPARIQWVPIPGGAFMMGEGSERRRIDVAPFEIAKTLVTNRQYSRCVKAGACEPIPKSLPKQHCGEKGFVEPDHPAVCVDWRQAKKFSEWAGGRLPTEAEWEYAARSGGKDQKYPWGDEPPTCARAVVADPRDGDGCGRHSTWPVCSKPAGNTAQGLCDMAGNAEEWVQDWWHDDKDRIQRGGAWCGEVFWVRSDIRRSESPDMKDDALGFRPARDRKKNR